MGKVRTLLPSLLSFINQSNIMENTITKQEYFYGLTDEERKLAITRHLLTVSKFADKHPDYTKYENRFNLLKRFQPWQ